MALVPTTSGSQKDWTGIPSWVRNIVISFNGVSTDGSGYMYLRLGDSGGLETTGYDSATAWSDAGGTGALYSSTLLYLMHTLSAAWSANGQAVLTMMDQATNLWSMQATFGTSPQSGSTTFTASGGGSKALSGALDRFSIVLSAGSFDAGNIGVTYW